MPSFAPSGFAGHKTRQPASRKDLSPQAERDILLAQIGERRRDLARQMQELTGAIGTPARLARQKIDALLQDLAAQRQSVIARFA
jgi:hypothetical protein